MNQVDLLIQWRESDGINIIILIVILEFVIWAIFMFNFFFTSSLLFSSSSLLYPISPLKNLVDSSFSFSSSSSSFSFPLSCSKFCCMMMMMMQLILSYSDFFSSYWASLLSHQSHSHHLGTQYSVFLLLIFWTTFSHNNILQVNTLELNPKELLSIKASKMRCP